jgi:hypothetical protein
MVDDEGLKTQKSFEASSESDSVQEEESLSSESEDLKPK